MVTKEDVQLAAQGLELGKKVKELRDKHLVLTQEEEARRLEWSKVYHSILGEIRAASEAQGRAGDAARRIYQEVPLDMRREAELAGANVRAHGEYIARARLEVQAAQGSYEKTMKSIQEGKTRLTKGQIEELQNMVCEKKAQMKAEEKKRDELVALQKKKQSAVDEKIVQIKRGVK